MDNTQAAQFVFDQNHFRIGELIWLATCNDGMSAPDALEEAIEDGQIVAVFGELRGVDDPYDKEQVLGWLIDERKLGFLARVDTPTPIAAHGKGRSYSSGGWGMYGMQWIYAETLDELLSKAAEASNSYIDKRLAKLRKEKSND